MTALAESENFYVIIGSSAGVLVGLQCVVMGLIVSSTRRGAFTHCGAIAVWRARKTYF
jgi:hypothetical protein